MVEDIAHSLKAIGTDSIDGVVCGVPVTAMVEAGTAVTEIDEVDGGDTDAAKGNVVVFDVLAEG